MKYYKIAENGLYFVWGINEENEVKLLHFSAMPFEESTLTSRFGTEGFHMVEVQVTGENRPTEFFGTNYGLTAPAYRLKYREHRDYRNEDGRKIEITSEDPETGLVVTSHFQFFDGVQMLRSWTELLNGGEKDLGIEYVSSFALTGIEKEGLLDWDEKLEVLIGHNAWQKELVFSKHSLPELGMAVSQKTGPRRSSQAVSIGNTGNWSTKQYLPLGALKNTETGAILFWQIENNGSWYWEIADEQENLYLQCAGPDELHAHWWKNLKPGERFTSVCAGVGSVYGDIDEMGAELTKYRRRIRRKNEDNEKLPVIFNDYMNCLFGDPTTEKEIPMVDKAAEAGCEYYVIDAGWYSDGYWWDGVGEWLPSEKRFPGGLKKLLSYIRSRGMIPGLWLEIEVMGRRCPKAEMVSDDWFFQRHGKVLCYRSRYQLDFRNPQVRAHATEVVDRLVDEYGVGYIKMDYNIEQGIGTDYRADSCGDGLLEHCRAYLAWLAEMFQKHPGLVIENCSSGGMRMDYAMLSRCSIQSTSDMEDYREYASIAANAPMAVTPEQAAVWSYPLTEGDREEVIFNMVNALLLRIHQSGHLINIGPERFGLVKEALDFYKEIREKIREGLPFWPAGLAGYGDPWVSMGLRTEEEDYIAVWRRNSERPVVSLPVKHRKGEEMEAVCVYPSEDNGRLRWNKETGELTAELSSPVSARIFRLRKV